MRKRWNWFLRRSAIATKLAAVQADLARYDLGLKVFDCYRPLSVQQRIGNGETGL